jgi:carboxyl-terminal processing protease
VTSRSFFLFVSPLVLAVLWFAVSRVRFVGPELYWDDEVRSEVQEIVADRYLEPLDAAAEQELFDASMRAYVGTLDPFSRYFTPTERRELDEDTTGSFAGVGVQVQLGETGLLVSAVYRGGPADIAGLEPGDVVTHADGTDITQMALDESILRVKGDEGTDVVLTVLRGDDAPQDFVVTRGIVGLDTVPAVHLLPGRDGAPGVAYVRVAQFSETTPDEVRAALAELVDAGGASSIVLDLRQNLGGVVSAAVDLAALFLPEGELVCVTRARDGARRYSIEREDGEASPLYDQPLVVLVDGGSASASEILAGALQDHGRAVLVGERTYGKFLVQTLLPLRTSEALVRVTTARYETPRGRSGQRNERTGARGGIVPDVRVDLDQDGRRAVFSAFRDQAGPRWRVLEGRDGAPAPDDVHLNSALDLLHGDPPPAEALELATVEQG